MSFWPLAMALTAEGTNSYERALTLVKLPRLASLHLQLAQIVEDQVPGDVIEAGVWRGGCCIWMRTILDSIGDTRKIVLADTFQGFPPPDVERYPMDARDLKVIPWRTKMGFVPASMAEVQANFARYGLLSDLVEFVEGPFRDTLWNLKGRLWSLIRLDGDSYEATRVSLDCLYEGLSPGGYCISDDYGDPGKTKQAKKAVDDFRAEWDIMDPLEWADSSCISWRKS